jgi:methylase of polypeptide subunit release factors
LNEKVKVAVEIGCGAGGISQNILNHCSHLEKLLFTDIDPNAINCARRNLKPLAQHASVSWVIGKGIEGITAPGTVDLLVSNPPYIPTPSGDGDKDHYSGTKLIRRLFRDGIKLLNPENPDAAIYVQMSSVTLPDFERYCQEFPEVEVTQIGKPVRVPLRISGLIREPEVLDFVMKQGGLEYVKNDPLGYYHEIMAFRLKRRE